MTLRTLCKWLRFGTLTTVAGCICSPGLFAQGPLPEAPAPSIQTASIQLAAIQPMAIQPGAVQPVSPTIKTASIPTSEHRFWDRENVVLFAASAALTTGDFMVTRANLQNGGRELNPVVRIFGRSSAGLAVNFAGETAGVIGLSYFFHRTGHHRLERLTSFVNMSASAGAVSYGMAHR